MEGQRHPRASKPFPARQEDLRSLPTIAAVARHRLRRLGRQCPQLIHNYFFVVAGGKIHRLPALPGDRLKGNRTGKRRRPGRGVPPKHLSEAHQTDKTMRRQLLASLGLAVKPGLDCLRSKQSVAVIH